MLACPVVDELEPVAAKYAADWPAWSHREIHWLTALMSPPRRWSGRCGGMACSNLSTTRAKRRELAKARKAAFARPPTGPNQVWQLDFSEYETTTGGVWRLAGMTDYFTKYEHGWHIAPTCTGADAIVAVKIAIDQAEALAGCSLADPATGQVRKIKLVTDNGSAFKGTAFARFIASRTEFVNIRTRRRSPGQNGVRERAFASLKYEHLYRIEVYTDASLHPQHSSPGI